MKEIEKFKVVNFVETLPSITIIKAKQSTAKARIFFLGLILCSSVTAQAIAAESAPFFVIASDLSPTKPKQPTPKPNVSIIKPKFYVVASDITPNTLKQLAPVKTPNLLSINPKRANFKQEIVSEASRYLADWVVDSKDNQHLPFVIIDKKAARVFVFNVEGKLIGSAPALLGLSLGDDAIPEIGKMSLANIKPEQRTTPAGRFVATLGRNLHGKEVLWVDYNGAISLHRVVTSSLKERRLQRLESTNPLERRISYGCINVPVKFYDRVVSPTFTGTNGVVYVLPDTRLVQEVFGSYDVEDPSPKQALISQKDVQVKHSPQPR
jgi:hypothetical protein